jgi:hypothetical protein
LYTALTLQAQTVEYAIQSIQLEEYKNGVLAYAIAQIAHTVSLQQQVAREKQIAVACDLFNNSQDGFVQGTIVYKSAPEGYQVKVSLTKAGQAVGGLHALIMRETATDKKVYSCVALEAF